LDDIIRAVIAINPDDSNALFLAATRSENLSIAKAYLKKLEGTSFYADAAFSVAMKNKDTEERLQFLDGLEMTPALNMLKLIELAFAERYVEYRNLSNGDASFDKLKPVLDGTDASFAAGWSAKLAAAACQSGNKEASHKWVDYGITRDPNQKDLQELAKLFENDKTACLAAINAGAQPNVSKNRGEPVKQLQAVIARFTALSSTNADVDSLEFDVNPSPSGSLVSPYIGNVDYVVPVQVGHMWYNSPPTTEEGHVHVRAWLAYQDAEWVFKELKPGTIDCGPAKFSSLTTKSLELLEQHRKRWQTATGR